MAHNFFISYSGSQIVFLQLWQHQKNGRAVFFNGKNTYQFSTINFPKALIPADGKTNTQVANINRRKQIQTWF